MELRGEKLWLANSKGSAWQIASAALKVNVPPSLAALKVNVAESSDTLTFSAPDSSCHTEHFGLANESFSPCNSTSSAYPTDLCVSADGSKGSGGEALEGRRRYSHARCWGSARPAGCSGLPGLARRFLT